MSVAYEYPQGFTCCRETPIPTVAINQGHEETFKKLGRILGGYLRVKLKADAENVELFAWFKHATGIDDLYLFNAWLDGGPSL